MRFLLGCLFMALAAIAGVAILAVGAYGGYSYAAQVCPTQK